MASVGAEPVLPDAWGVDLCVIGAQKAMGGPAGVSAISVSERAWALALGGGLEPYVREARDAAPVATTLRVPDAVDASELVAKALTADPALPLAAGGGALAGEMVRVHHYGPDATPEAVHASLAGLGAALTEFGVRVDLEAGRTAAAGAWGE